jgi:hypothetical protein
MVYPDSSKKGADDGEREMPWSPLLAEYRYRFPYAG